MAEWWNSLTLLQQIFAGVAIPATVILVLQTLLLLFGAGMGDHDADFDSDADGDVDVHDGDGGHDTDVSGLRLFTIRGMVAFFSVGGWLGVVVADTGASPFLSILSALLGGAASMAIVALFFKWIIGLQESGNTDYSNAIGKTAEVYITIPEKGKGRGKIIATVSSQLTEVDAVNEGDTPIKPRTQVIITGINGDNTYVVKPCE